MATQPSTPSSENNVTKAPTPPPPTSFVLFNVDVSTGIVSNVVLRTDVSDDDSTDDDSSSDDPRIPKCDASIRGRHEEQLEAPTDECADERIIRAINTIMTEWPMFPNTPMQGPRTDDINAKISPAVDPAKSNMGSAMAKSTRLKLADINVDEADAIKNDNHKD